MQLLRRRFFRVITGGMAPRIVFLLPILGGFGGCQKATPQHDPGQNSATTLRRVDLDTSPTPLPPGFIRPSVPPDPLPRLIETLQARGGKITRDDTGIVAIDWHRAPIHNLDLELLTEIPTLKRLYLSGTRIDSRGWVYLGALPNLERLALWKTPFCDLDVQYLAGAKHLKVLDLSDTRIKGTTLSQLAGSQSLETLILKSTDCDEESMRQVANVKSLKVLDLISTGIVRGSLIAPLKRLPHLEELKMDFCDPEILRQLAEFPNIRRLDLSRPFTRTLSEAFPAIGKMEKLESIRYRGFGNQDEFLSHIAKCPNLRTIQMVAAGRSRRARPTQFTDEGLAKLAACRSLRLLDVRAASVTLGGLREIAKANPDVRILVHPITLHGLDDAFRSMGLGARHSRDEGPRLRIDREMHIIALRLEDARIFLPSLKLIAKAIDPERLEHLGLGHTDLTDEGLAYFRAGVHLKHLNLEDTRITPDGLKAFGGGAYPELPFLETLDLSGTALDDECLAWIGTLDQLKTLRLANVQGVTEKGWASLKGLTNLETLEK